METGNELWECRVSEQWDEGALYSSLTARFCSNWGQSRITVFPLLAAHNCHSIIAGQKGAERNCLVHESSALRPSLSPRRCVFARAGKSVDRAVISTVRFSGPPIPAL